MTVTATIPSLTPEQLAECFWSLDGQQQARFFGSLGALALGTPAPFSKELGSYFGLDMQMFDASRYCTPNGLRAMELIGQNTSGERLQPYLECWQKMPDVSLCQGKEAA